MKTAAEVLRQLQSQASPAHLAGMARFGMTVEKRYGVSVPQLRRIAKDTGKDHQLAGSLWDSGIAEAKIVASMIAVPNELSAQQMNAWVVGFDSWDVCDQVCMNLFAKTPFARQKISEWSKREEEFVKRAAFVLIACLAWHDKKAPDQDFLDFLPIIQRGATDERNFVRKAVNWALRNIGKRNAGLNQVALEAAKAIRRMDSKAARWIAADAIRELDSAAVQARLAK